jgi:hypothetical protein
MDQECIDTTDALNFNNLAIGAESATNPIVKKLLMLNYLLFQISYLNIFELFVTKILYLTEGRNVR